jgi:diaminohydroxyphosphoribosylaminopyrimidine deaminase/5-amino-6-(5-phosphoribosylamino)uracil reductase
MKKAIEAASIGVGNTYPNPAVGCVLVSSDEVIGVGAHPKAGYPHAEVFALFEACGYVESGVEAATTVVNSTKKANSDDTPDISKVDELMAVYSSTDGAKELFKGKLSDKDVTAYVTLEPCCHYGKTPPCAFSLVQAGVKRVVVGFRDPNPRVDGGGVTLLQNEGIHVDLMLKDESEAESKEEAENAKACSDIVSAFVKRISPRTEEDGMALVDYDESMNGAKRRQLRSIAGRKKKDGSMMEFYWPAYSDSVDASDDSIDLEEAIGELSFDHRWMETIDGALWEHEIILLRLTNAVQKKKGAKILGERIAEELNAHVAQVVGHTALLYRPGRPPVLDLLSDA